MNKDYVQRHARQKWAEVGYPVVGYEGFQYGFWGSLGYGGAQVWYTLKRTPDNGVLYSGYLQD